MSETTSVEQMRRSFADEVAAVAHIRTPALADAFARVPRELFLGPGPWQIVQAHLPTMPYVPTPDASVQHIYHNVVVALDPARQLNNGQPSSLALWFDAAAIQPGDSVFHLGCGVGYYSAILAEVVGPSGRVVACEIDAGLAAQARTNLAAWPQVVVVNSDGADPGGPYDVFFVNAGATHALPGWLSAIAPGGRLVMPLTIHISGLPNGFGYYVCATRSNGRWPLRPVTPVGIYDCAGARDPAAEPELEKLLRSPEAARAAFLMVDPHTRSPACMYHRDGFCLQE